MSQVNKFNQINNPDYVYFDLQQSNMYNTTEIEQQPLKFTETRETPIVANSGDYYMSVTRFQLDTYNLPVLVGEPDLTQTGTYDPNQTIYKVAYNIAGTSLKPTANVSIFEPVERFFPTSNMRPSYGSFSYLAKPSIGDTKINLVIASDVTRTIDLYSGYAPSVVKSSYTVDDLYICESVGVSEDGLYIVSGGFKATYVWNTLTKKIISTDALTDTGTATLNKSQRAGISGDGTRVFVGRPDLGQFQVFTNTGTSINPLSPVITPTGYTPSTVGSGISWYSGFSSSTDGKIVVFADAFGNTSNGVFFRYEWNNGQNTYIRTKIDSGSTYARLGYSHSITRDGSITVIGAPFTGSTGPMETNGAGEVRVDFGTTTQITLPFPAQGGVNFGLHVSISADGTYIYTTTKTGAQRYQKTGATTYTEITETEPKVSPYDPEVTGFNGQLIHSTNSGTGYVFGRYGSTSAVISEIDYFITKTTTLGQTFALPTMSPIIQPVLWINELTTLTPPNKNVLTGKNTALYPYYYCNSYNNFITMVNKALKLAYFNFIEKLFQQWVEPYAPTNEHASFRGHFRTSAAIHYPSAPFIEWNETNLTADVYVTMLFETLQTAVNNVINNINYAMPQTSWILAGSTYTGTPLAPTPYKFELAFNASLYSLFNSLPAKKRILTNDLGINELYYVLDFYSSGLGLINPEPPLNSVNNYSFLTIDSATGVITLGGSTSFVYSHPRLLIKQVQEISTIDTWSPINAIVFTTTSLPVVTNQFTATSSVGSNPPVSSIDSNFGFIITDLQSNQQGFRPNVLYTPTAEYRRIDLTGNQPIKNINISVFWRSKSGDLIPITLASGAMASIKLLFEKKLLAEDQKLNIGMTDVRNII